MKRTRKSIAILLASAMVMSLTACGGGSTIYGGSFKFKNGKRYYRIGKNQYIKVANIRFGGDPA